MALFDKSKSLDNKELSELTEEQRRQKIEAVELEREDVVFQLEELMQKLSRATKRRHLRKRKYKLGQSPNDFSSKR